MILLKRLADILWRNLIYANFIVGYKIRRLINFSIYHLSSLCRDLKRTAALGEHLVCTCLLSRADTDRRVRRAGPGTRSWGPAHQRSHRQGSCVTETGRLEGCCNPQFTTSTNSYVPAAKRAAHTYGEQR